MLFRVHGCSKRLAVCSKLFSNRFNPVHSMLYTIIGKNIFTKRFPSYNITTDFQLIEPFLRNWRLCLQSILHIAKFDVGMTKRSALYVHSDDPVGKSIAPLRFVDYSTRDFGENRQIFSLQLEILLKTNGRCDDQLHPMTSFLRRIFPTNSQSVSTRPLSTASGNVRNNRWCY